MQCLVDMGVCTYAYHVTQSLIEFHKILESGLLSPDSFTLHTKKFLASETNKVYGVCISKSPLDLPRFLRHTEVCPIQRTKAHLNRPPRLAIFPQ